MLHSNANSGEKQRNETFDLITNNRLIRSCLDAARSLRPYHQTGLEAIKRLLELYPHVFMSQYEDIDLKNVDISTNEFSESRTFFSRHDVSASTTTGDSEDFTIQSPPSSCSIEQSILSNYTHQYICQPRHNLDNWDSLKFLRNRKIERRYSGDALEYNAIFDQKYRKVQQRLRRQKSLNDETLDNAAWQEVQLSQIREESSQNIPVYVKSRFYRRCRSASLVENTASMTGESLEVSRKYSLSSIRSSIGVGEVWPETITSLLTGNQTIVDRFFLFGHLESVLCEYPKSHSLVSKRTHNLRLWSSGVSIPSPEKKWGGEDAFFTCDRDTGFIGVADGVGEWGEFGCNPRQFAEELMLGAKKEAIRLKFDSDIFSETRASLLAKRILQSGFYVTKSFGASTSIVAGLNMEGTTLGIANIGDSSCLILRRESKRHRQFVAFRRTKEQQHFFNCPYQLSRIPCEDDLPCLVSQGMHGLARVLKNFSLCYEGDTPEMADLYDIKVQEGDIVILATDGVFDNLFDQEIANLVSFAISPHEAKVLESAIKKSDFSVHPATLMPPEFHPIYGVATNPQNLAKAIAEAAFYRSMDSKAQTPFANQSRRAGGYFKGGKMDDITVVVAWIT